MKPDDQLADMSAIKTVMAFWRAKDQEELEAHQREHLQGLNDALAAIKAAVAPTVAALVEFRKAFLTMSNERQPHNHHRLHHRPRGRKRYRGMRKR